MTAFEEFGVMPEIGKAVEDMEWNLPTDVQEGYLLSKMYVLTLDLIWYIPLKRIYFKG